MKKRTLLINLIGLMVISLLVFQSCKKDNTTENQLPTCTISSPIPNQEIVKGETVTISVTATDADGTISEVQFYVDDVNVGSAASSPYNYEWNTSSESNGVHTLKATCKDNNNGSASDEITVTVVQGGVTITDPRDGQKYFIVDIGTQTWFAENLNYETPDSWWYDDNEANGTIYGRLYTWDAAQNACPDGWRLPSDDDWKILEMELGMSQAVADEDLWRGTQGDKMKSTSGWNGNGNGTNSSGFTGLPGGFYGTSYTNKGENGNWWTSTEVSSSTAWQRGLNNLDNRILRFDPPKTFRLSVRCVKN